MSRLKQAITIRDALVKRAPSWYRTDIGCVVVPVPGFECRLHRHADGGCSLQVWPRTEASYTRGVVISSKVLHLAWGGRGEQIDVYKPKAMYRLLALLTS